MPAVDPSDRVASSIVWTVACFATVAFFAAVVASYGVISLVSGVEPANSGVGIFVLPAAIAASGLAVLLTLLCTLRHPNRPLNSVLWAAFWSWIAALIIGFIGQFISVTGASSLGSALFFVVQFGLGWFGLVIPVIAAICGALAAKHTLARHHGKPKPHWPWE